MWLREHFCNDWIIDFNQSNDSALVGMVFVSSLFPFTTGKIEIAADRENVASTRLPNPATSITLGAEKMIAPRLQVHVETTLPQFVAGSLKGCLLQRICQAP
jgi:hypothetical protein